jgi:hypothetical protein
LVLVRDPPERFVRTYETCLRDARPVPSFLSMLGIIVCAALTTMNCICVPRTRKVGDVGSMTLPSHLQQAIMRCRTSQILVASTNQMAASWTSPSRTGRPAIDSTISAEFSRQTWLRFNVAKSAVEPGDSANGRSGTAQWRPTCKRVS